MYVRACVCDDSVLDVYVGRVWANSYSDSYRYSHLYMHLHLASAIRYGPV